VPVKAAMAAMGLIEEIYRLPMVSPRAESRAKILRVLNDLALAKKPAFA
jgi:dihydrodipicolinate synthase/N-acetylneuraminate lyase